MAHFDKAIWAEIAPRFKELRGGQQVEKFLANHDLLGLKWRAMEDGRQGLSVESTVKLCHALNVSPTWLLFGRGHVRLDEISDELSRNIQKLFDALPDDVQEHYINLFLELFPDVTRPDDFKDPSKKTQPRPKENRKKAAGGR